MWLNCLSSSPPSPLTQSKVLRDYYQNNPKETRRMAEKVRASALFRGKKSLYNKT